MEWYACQRAAWYTNTYVSKCVFDKNDDIEQIDDFFLKFVIRNSFLHSPALGKHQDSLFCVGKAIVFIICEQKKH